MAEKLTKTEKTNKVSPAKKSKDKKVGFASKIKRFFRDLKGEFNKIVWSSKKQVINNTIVVIVFMIIVAIFIFALDNVLGFLTNLIYGLAK